MRQKKWTISSDPLGKVWRLNRGSDWHSLSFFTLPVERDREIESRSIFNVYLFISIYLSIYLSFLISLAWRTNDNSQPALHDIFISFCKGMTSDFDTVVSVPVLSRSLSLFLHQFGVLSSDRIVMIVFSLDEPMNKASLQWSLNTLQISSIHVLPTIKVYLLHCSIIIIRQSKQLIKLHRCRLKRSHWQQCFQHKQNHVPKSGYHVYRAHHR